MALHPPPSPTHPCAYVFIFIDLPRTACLSQVSCSYCMEPLSLRVFCLSIPAADPTMAVWGRFSLSPFLSLDIGPFCTAGNNTVRISYCCNIFDISLVLSLYLYRFRFPTYFHSVYLFLTLIVIRIFFPCLLICR